MSNMTEYTISKDRYMQTYNYPDRCTVSFYNGARMDTAIVPTFAAYAKVYSSATFYVDVPYAEVKAYLKALGI